MKLFPSARCTARLAVMATLSVILAPAVARATAPTFVQGAAFATGTRVGTTTVTLTSPVAGGDLLVGWFAQYDVPGEVQVSDNVNGAWTRAMWRNWRRRSARRRRRSRRRRDEAIRVHVSL